MILLQKDTVRRVPNVCEYGRGLGDILVYGANGFELLLRVPFQSRE